MTKTRSAWIAFFILLLVLLGIRIALPEVVQWYVNDKIDESPNYSGSIGDVDLSLLRGGYRIDLVEINKTSGDVPVPFFSAKVVEFSLLWSALLDGALVGEATFFEPKINVVDSESEARKQTGKDGNWLTLVDELSPFKIDKVTVFDGELHFRNFDTDPKVDIFISDMTAYAYNLTNSKELAQSMVATVDVNATAMTEGNLSLSMRFDPSLQQPTFDLNSKLLDLPITQLDDFIRAYAPFDVEAGSLDLVVELVANDGQLTGYVKPLIRGLEVFEWKEDIEKDHDNPLQAVWEALVGGVSELLENQPRDQIASRVPIEGDISDPQTQVLATIGNILKNAFVDAFQANLENSVSLNFGKDDEDDADAAEKRSIQDDDVEDTAQKDEP